MHDPLAPAPSPVLSLASSTRVPNVFPTVDVPYKLAIVGEAPGETEESYGQPFLGASGKLLDSILGSVGVLRAGCFVGNVCQYRPPGNDLKVWGYEHERVLEGRRALDQDLATFAPNCILALGNTAMWAVTGKPFGIKDSGYSIEDYTNFIGQNSQGQKYVGAYHPAYVLRDYSTWVLLRFAAQRARQEADSPIFSPPQRSFDLDLSASEICHKLDTWPSGQPASIDIEGGLNGWICLSVVPAHNYGFIIAFGQHSDSEQARLYTSISRFLYRSDIPKILQNSLYEGFVLGYGFNMRVRNVREDTMLKSWEIYPELPKGLDTVASLWTREPAWKHLIAYSKKEQQRRAKLPDYDPAREIRNKHLACCIDSAVTLEASDAQSSALSSPANRHYRFNMDLLPGLLYMELRGIRYDKATAAIERGQVLAALSECATRLELRCGKSLTGAKGSISSQKLSRLLYQEKGYPVQYKGRGPTKKVSADVEALLNLSKKHVNDPLLSDILLHRKLESIRETLEVETDPDGRVRCAYNLVGTETGRLTCYTSPTGSGANLQTITKKLRKLYTADEGKWLFQCDLSGADGWTVAARCLSHGDDTMWLDYLAGIKPAKVIALMYAHGTEVTRCSREELADRCKTVDGNGWLYAACKATQHGSNYGMLEKTMSVNIMKQSYKYSGQAVYVEPSICSSLQRYYLTRYWGVLQWHEWAKNEIVSGRNLTSASGHTRVFFGRRKSYNARFKRVEADQDTWRAFLADEPQENTTYATNLALHKLWHDPENRVGDSLFIEPLHQVHDALIGQFPRERTEWAVKKLNSYFNNPLVIAGTELVIPFEGEYGPSWGELGAKYGGGVI